MDDNDRKFETGARRTKDADGTRYDLISPIGLKALAETYAFGAEKYADHNWEMGMPVHDLLNHSIKHIYDYLGGDRSEQHLPHAAWGLIAAIHSEALWPDLNESHQRARGCRLTKPMIDACKRQLAENLFRRQATEVIQSGATYP